MFHRLAPGTLLYRVGRLGDVWPDPIRGLGAYYTEGGRYNVAHQPTIYASESPLVAITEGGFYHALAWQERIAGVRKRGLMSYPLVSEESLWCFSTGVDEVPLIDIQDRSAISKFTHASHLALNPSRSYALTQELANQIRSYIPPSGSRDPRPFGMRAPSVRTPMQSGIQPSQVILFAGVPYITPPFDVSCTLLGHWLITYEFQEPQPRRSVDRDSTLIDWERPQYQLRNSPQPGFANDKLSNNLMLNRWRRIRIKFC